MGAAFFIMLGITALLSIPIITASFAYRMGRSPIKWFFIGLVLPVVASFILFFLPDLSDHKDLEFGTKYGFTVGELRLLTRGIVVLDKDNTVKHIEYVPEITDHPDYDKALEIVKSL